MKFKPDQCESFTRSSQYTVRCKRKGFFCKTSKKFRCPNHAGMSTGPKTKRGKLKSLQNEEKKFLDSVNEKYGEGTLNPETGVFTPIESENKSE